MTTARLTHPRPAALRAVVVGILSVVALSLVALVLGGTAASAHDTVIGTSPSDGETVTTAPTEVSVEISAVPQSIGSRMLITSSDGTVLFDGEPTISERTAIVELPAVANDQYQVAWRLVSSDGHPIEGAFGFGVEDPAAAAPAEDPTEAETTEAAETTATETTQAADPTTDASASTDAATSPAADSGDGSGTSWVAIALIVVVIGGLVLLVLFRRRSALQDQS